MDMNSPVMREVIPLRVIDRPLPVALAIVECGNCAHRERTHRGMRWHCTLNRTSCWEARAPGAPCGPDGALHLSKDQQE